MKGRPRGARSGPGRPPRRVRCPRGCRGPRGRDRGRSPPPGARVPRDRRSRGDEWEARQISFDGGATHAREGGRRPRGWAEPQGASLSVLVLNAYPTVSLSKLMEPRATLAASCEGRIHGHGRSTRRTSVVVPRRSTRSVSTPSRADGAVSSVSAAGPGMGRLRHRRSKRRQPTTTTVASTSGILPSLSQAEFVRRTRDAITADLHAKV